MYACLRIITVLHVELYVVNDEGVSRPYRGLKRAVHGQAVR